jgi:hypothetical protein
VERVIGTLRRELFDDVIVRNEQRNPAMLLSSQSSKAFAMFIFRRLHEYAGRTAVTLLQRFDSALNLNIHVHTLFLDLITDLT